MSKLAGVRRRAVVAELIKRMREAGSWSGETHVQKNLYLLDTLLGVPTDYGFTLYRYGPYSFELHDDIVGMTATGFLEFESQIPYGPSLGVTSRAANVLRRFPRTIKEYEDELCFVANKLSNDDVISLERLATALYVTKESGGFGDVESRARELHRLKPHVSLKDARLSMERLGQLVEDANRAGFEVNL